MPKKAKKPVIGVVENDRRDGCVIRLGSECVTVPSTDVIRLPDGTARVKANARIIRVFRWASWDAPRAVRLPDSFKRRFDFEHGEAKRLGPMVAAVRIATLGKDNVGLSVEEIRRRRRRAKDAAAPQKKKHAGAT